MFGPPFCCCWLLVESSISARLVAEMGDICAQEIGKQNQIKSAGVYILGTTSPSHQKDPSLFLTQCASFPLFTSFIILSLIFFLFSFYLLFELFMLYSFPFNILSSPLPQ
jgi:hypothetical protein